MFIKSKILLLFIYFMFLFENVTDDFLVKKEISLIKIRNEIPNEGSSSSGNNNSEGLSRGGKKPVLRSMRTLPLKGSEKSLHCHHRHHHKDKHCHGKKKHIVHQHIPSKPKGKNTIRLLRALRMKDPDDPEQNPSDMPSDEPHHSDDEEELCDDDDDDDDDDDEICDDEEEEKRQKEKEREEMENKHDQIDSGRKRQHKRKVRKNKNKSRPRGSGKHFSEKICGPCKNINMEDLE
ncbi:hypothetical protein [Cryptosporidium parvum Iowa II]|uniref:Uncharacterized protein n=2 Tax=Cryptosporidium parvum TaxID=5807 RepID=Q5CPE9_CRYPI|nr:hypothetical protein [Cryptosporidium parvum Iowa II]EAK87300.1 conserved hypothetical protein [Cryptosporidium parvum Iowa II]QOY41434.1 Uncharacterized protein (MEDLE gene family) [Cryptosporidium parvum]WKS77653.1 hypothetical protein CPCDC_5g5490 [Cryptosporidium sp. 43IA8]WRK32144.1 MEDLE gene family protein [Cryptosporidium parvum]|eukprot:QOY41434.1 hypothetical protein CPATCC_001987 [Cryptosporidium parvum]